MSYGAPQGPVNPYQSPTGYGPGPGFNPATAHIASEISSQATASLVVGIISFFICGLLLGPFAIYRGSKALRLIQQYNIGHEHSGKANAGKIIGIISTSLNAIVILIYVVVIIIAIASGEMR